MKKTNLTYVLLLTCIVFLAEVTNVNAQYCDFDGDGFAGVYQNYAGWDIPYGYCEQYIGPGPWHSGPLGDCNDNCPAIYPGAFEDPCDGIANDCNLGGGGSCVPQNLTFYRDADGDGFPVQNDIAQGYCLSMVPGYINGNCNSFQCLWDCDDNNYNAHPLATEKCNSYDDNCNGINNEGFVKRYYRDDDGDDYGNINAKKDTVLCSPPPGYVVDSTDCNDNVFLNNGAGIHPGAPEGCNGIDNNCDGKIDEKIYYFDNDHDGYGSSPIKIVEHCGNAPKNYAELGGDCDDNDRHIAPDNVETCNGIDDNCEHGILDEQNLKQKYYKDLDHDGFGGEFIGVVCDDDQPFGSVTNNADCNDTTDSIGRCRVAPPTVAAKSKGRLGPLHFGDPVAHKIVTDDAGSAYLIGFFTDTAYTKSSYLVSAGGKDMFIIKYDSVGNLKWLTSIGSTADDFAAGITLSNSNGGVVCVTGVSKGNAVSFNSPSATVINRTVVGSQDFFVATLNATSGNFIAAQMSGATSTGLNSDKVSSSIAVSSDGNTVYVCGGIASCGNGSYGSSIPNQSACGSPLIPFLSKYDSNCNLLQVVIPQNVDNICDSAMMTDVFVQPSAASGYADKIFVAGFTAGQTNVGGNIIGETNKFNSFYAVYDPSFAGGNPSPIKINSLSNGSGKSTGITVNDSGYVYLTHSIENGNLNSCNSYTSDGLEDAYLTKFDKNSAGSCVWNKKIGTSGNDKLTAIAMGEGDSVYVSGFTNASPIIDTVGFQSSGNYDGFIAKYDGTGKLYWMIPIGGAGDDYANGIALHQKDIYVAGSLMNSTIIIDIDTLTADSVPVAYYISLGVLNPITISSVSAVAFCEADSFTVDFNSPGAHTGNHYLVEISDSAGSFNASKFIGNLLSDSATGTIRCKIPPYTPAGIHYRLRIKSTSPENFSLPNQNDISITTGSTWYADQDSDGFGSDEFVDSVRSCSQPVGYVVNHNDCFDRDSAIYPGAVERCNNLDDNCNGLSDEGLDIDNDDACIPFDNCPLTFNPDQADYDNNGIGDVCDCIDSDGDGICNSQSDCEWVTVGLPPTISSNYSYPFETNFTFSANGTPYVVFTDYGFSVQLRVRKLDNNYWQDIGSVGFANGGTYSRAGIAVSPTDIPYIALAEAQANYQTSVLKFDGSNWVHVGAPGFAPLGNDYKLLFDATGNVYLGYSGCVMKFNGTSWDTLGTPVFSNDNNFDLTKGPGDTLYLVFCNLDSAHKATVKKFDGNNWINVGNPGFSIDTVNATSIAIDANGNPYVVFSDYANDYKTTVMKFDGTSWNNVGSAGFSDRATNITDIAIDTAGSVYVAFRDSARATVKKFNGSAWENICSPRFAEAPNCMAFAFDNMGTPHVMTNNTSYYYANQPILWKYQPCVKPDVPVLSVSSDTTCSGDYVLLNIDSGNLNNATTWKWYTGNCGGTFVGSGQYIYDYPTESTIYYVRGEGGCVTPGLCASITIHVNTPTTWYQDLDGDGFGDNSANYSTCIQPSGYVSDNTDCDDYNDSIHVGCTIVTYYADYDDDGYGDINTTIVTGNSVPPYGFVLDSTDCSIYDSYVHPNAPEICNSIDDDCDGLIDVADTNFILPTWYADADGDGYGDSLVISHACPQPEQYVDNYLDCDDTQILYYDFDGDGFGGPYVGPCGLTTSTDCYDFYSAIYPGALEICDWLDNDCNGVVDDTCAPVISLSIFIEGFYTGNWSMQPSLYNSGASTDPSIADIITVELRAPLDIETIVASQTVNLSVSGFAEVVLPQSVIDGEYYIVVRHRNAIETWSKLPVIIGSITNYDFR